MSSDTAACNGVTHAHASQILPRHCKVQAWHAMQAFDYTHHRQAQPYARMTQALPPENTWQLLLVGSGRSESMRRVLTHAPT